MAPEVIKNTGLKIGHRLTAEDDRNLLGGTMSANPTQLEQMATFLPGEALITFEGLLRPFKAQICQWEKGTASYEPPSNEELADIMSNHSGYKDMLHRSSQISCAKFNAVLRKISNEVVSFIDDYNKLDKNLAKLKAFMKDNNIGNDKFYNAETENPSVKKAQEDTTTYGQERQRLYGRLEDIFESINELLVKIKGYLYQNKAHKKETALLLLEFHDYREKLFENYKDKYEACAESYDEFSKEMKGWNLTSLLEDVNLYTGGE
jgi:hypothetical protein